MGVWREVLKLTGISTSSGAKKTDLSIEDGKITSQYATINRLPKDTVHCDMGGFNLKHRLGKGTYGSVYEACRAKDCRYVAKIIKLNNKMDISIFWVEVLAQRKGAMEGFAPYVHRAFTCVRKLHGYYGVIIMDRVGSSLAQLPISEEKHYRKIHALVRKMHKTGMFHQDLYDRNLAWSLDYQRFYIIDFGGVLWYDGNPGLPRVVAAAEWAGLVYGQPSGNRLHSKIGGRWLESWCMKHYGYEMWARAIRAKVDASFDGKFHYSDKINCDDLYGITPNMDPKVARAMQMYWRHCLKIPKPKPKRKSLKLNVNEQRKARRVLVIPLSGSRKGLLRANKRGELFFVSDKARQRFRLSGPL
jgi:hypothetical protein